MRESCSIFAADIFWRELSRSLLERFSKSASILSRKFFSSFALDSIFSARAQTRSSAAFFSPDVFLRSSFKESAYARAASRSADTADNFDKSSAARSLAARASSSNSALFPRSREEFEAAVIHPTAHAAHNAAKIEIIIIELKSIFNPIRRPPPIPPSRRQKTIFPIPGRMDVRFHFRLLCRPRQAPRVWL